MSEVKPLDIPREKLVSRLKEVAQEAEAKRNEAVLEAEKRRETVLDAVRSLSDDQVANIFNHFINGNDAELVKWIEDKVENHKFETIETEPSAVETTIEKQIRVLELASNETVEVRPSDSLYAYL